MANVLNSFSCGVILIIIGLLYSFRSLLSITIPIFRIACSILLVYAGIYILTGPIPTNDAEHKAVFFDKVAFSGNEAHRIFNNIFGQTSIDFSSVTELKEKRTVAINDIFGTVEIILNPQIPTKINIERALVHIRAPEQNTATQSSLLPAPLSNLFGTYVYQNYQQGEPLLEIRSRAVFGTMVIR